MGTTTAVNALRGVLPTRLYPWDRVRVAARAMNGLAHGAPPSQVAGAIGVRLLLGAARGCGGEVASGDVVIVGHHHDPRVRALLAWHGIAHVLLARERWDHDEGDVWVLTCELACPRTVVAGDLDELVAVTWAPERVVREWVPLARRLGAGAEGA